MLGRRRISAQMLYCLSPEKGKKDSKQRLLTPLKTLKSSVDPLIKRNPELQVETGIKDRN